MTFYSKVLLIGFYCLSLNPLNLISQIKIGLGMAYGVPIQTNEYNDDTFRVINKIGTSPFLDIEYNFAANWEVQLTLLNSSDAEKFQSIKDPRITFNIRSSSISLPITVERTFKVKGLFTSLRIGFWTSKEYENQQYGVSAEPFSSTITLVNGQYTETLKLVDYSEQLSFSNRYRLGLISGVSTSIPITSKVGFCVGIDHVYFSHKNVSEVNHSSSIGSFSRVNPYMKIYYRL